MLSNCPLLVRLLLEMCLLPLLLLMMMLKTLPKYQLPLGRCFAARCLTPPTKTRARYNSCTLALKPL
jgi:hypothetical protein